MITAKQTFISYDLKTFCIHVNTHEYESKDVVMTDEVTIKSSDHI